MKLRLIVLVALFCCPAFAQHVYWRLLTLTANSAFPLVGQWVSKDSGGSVISTSGATATASSSSFGAVANAINGTTDCSTFWQGGITTAGEWIKIQFAGAVAIDHIDMTSGCNGNYGLVDFSLQYSDDNSTWTTANSWYGATRNGTTTTTFGPSNVWASTLGKAWRVNSAGVSPCIGMSSLKLFDLSNSAVTTTSYSALASSNFAPYTAAWGALFPYASQAWGSLSSGAATWEYDFSAVQELGSISFSNSNIGGCGPPVSFTVEWSTDRSTWHSAGAFSPVWVGTQTKTFTLIVSSSSQVGAFVVGP